MLLTLVIISSLSLLVLSGLGLLLFMLMRYLQCTKLQVVEEIRNFIEAPSPDKPSPLADMTDYVASIFAHRISTSVIANLRGTLGGTAKAQNAEQLSEIGEANPGIGLITALAPGLVKRLGKNPAALFGLQALLDKLVGQLPGKVASSVGDHQKRWEL